MIQRKTMEAAISEYLNPEGIRLPQHIVEQLSKADRGPASTYELYCFRNKVFVIIDNAIDMPFSMFPEKWQKLCTKLIKDYLR